jgi:hypothetical protein
LVQKTLSLLFFSRMMLVRSVFSLLALVLFFGGAANAATHPLGSKAATTVPKRKSRADFINDRKQSELKATTTILHARDGAAARGKKKVVATATPVTKKPLDIPMKYAVGAGLILAFNSGFANGCCMSGAIVQGTKQAIAAVTGAWTNSAVSFAQGNQAAFQLQTTMILSYAFGSAIAGILNPIPTPFVLSESVGPGLLICSGLVFAASQMASKGQGSSTMIFALAAIANGLQNSITSVHTGNLVRSTHYSGMTSDLGTFVGQILGGNTANAFRVKVILGLMGAFWTGGALSVAVTDIYKTESLIFSAALYAVAGIVVLALRYLP